ncbi:MAG: hypothetical protein KF861_05915, partial [Planctomycetaceae bacterium]|nr:hypothetical protein [Planctomycetaceae bacterium]
MLEEVGFEGMVTEEVGDGLAQASGQVEGDVTEDAFHMGGPAGASAVVLFSERDIKHMEAAVLDFPAATQPAEQRGRIRLVAGKSGNGIGHTGTLFATHGGVAFEVDELFGSGRVEVTGVNEVGCRRERAGLDASAAYLDGPSR